MREELYIYSRIPNKNLVDHKLPPNIEALHNNFNYKKSKWLLSGLYHPQVSLISIYFIKRKMGPDIYSKYYKKNYWWELLMQRSQNLTNLSFSLK